MAARHSAAFGTLLFPWCPDTLRQPGILRQSCTGAWRFRCPDMVPPTGGMVHGAANGRHGSGGRTDWPPGDCPAGVWCLLWQARMVLANASTGYRRRIRRRQEPPGVIVPPIGGTVLPSGKGGGVPAAGLLPGGHGAANRRHCTAALLGGSKWGGGRGKALRGLAGTLGGVPRSRAVDRLHCSRPAGRRMRALRDFNVAIWGNVSMSGAAYVSWAPCGTACLAVGVSVPPSRPCPLIPRLLVRKLGFWRPALPAPRVPCPDPRCPGTVQEPRASSRHGRPRNGLGHAPTRKSAEPAASVACLQ